MKIILGLACLLTLLPSGSFAADQPAAEAPPLTLEDVIFDANYLLKMLGPKTLLLGEGKSGEINAELPGKLADAGFDKATRFFTFPPEATKPKLDYSVPSSFPKSMRQGRSSGSASFVALVGTDGKVKVVYCYQQTDRLFAIASGAAIAKRRYIPAKIQATTVPVLLDVTTSYRGDGFDNSVNPLIPLKPGTTPLPPPKGLPGG